MAGLARTQRANIFNGKLFIKGFSTMLVPTKRCGDLLIWHLLYKQKGNHISYLDNNTIPHLENVSLSELEMVRHVVGGCSEISQTSKDSEDEDGSDDEGERVTDDANIQRELVVNAISCKLEADAYIKHIDDAIASLEKALTICRYVGSIKMNLEEHRDYVKGYCVFGIK